MTVALVFIRRALVQHFPLPTGSLASLSLSPTGNYLAVWEGPLEVRLALTLIFTLYDAECPT